MGDFAPHGSQGGGFGGPGQVRHVPMIHVADPRIPPTPRPSSPPSPSTTQHSTFDTNDNTHLASFPHTFVRRAGRWSS